MTLIRRFFCALCALALLTPSAGAAQAQTAYLSLDERIAEAADGAEELVRLHVVAADDSPEAQALKLEVRDAVLARAQALLADCPDAESAYAQLSESLSDFERAATAVVRAHGCLDEVRAETGMFDFPERKYAGVVVPAGEYRALRVVIGAGEGQNWWCVLFPTLCSAGDGHSALAAWFAQWFGGMGA